MPKKKPLDSSNPERLIYKTEELTIEVLGGIRLEGLDRLRATLKIEFDMIAIRHNLDLYNDSQLEKFIRRTSEKLEINTYVISTALLELTNELEKYRLDKKKEQEDTSHKRKKLTAKEVRAAQAFLEEPDLLERTNELIGKSGVIGEEDNRLLMYLIFTSRLTANPLHIVSFGSSGTGKSHLQESVSDLIPEEETLSVTTLSENAFYYFERQALAHKLILIEDLDGAENVLYPLREIQSKKRISKTISRKSTNGETKTVTLTVEGPVSVAGCTTKESIYEDNSNRSFLIYLDESPQQDEKVMQYQRAVAAGRVNFTEQKEIKTLLQNTQRILQPLRVINPYAEQLALPKEVFKPRRTNNHYLQFIEAITFYHQAQRQIKVDENTGEEYIETTLEDIENANKLMKSILLRKSDELSGPCRDYFEHLKEHLHQTGQKQFVNSEISRLFRIPLTTIKRYHKSLVAGNYLKVGKQPGSKTHFFEVVSTEEYKTLQQTISTALDTALESLKKNTPVKSKNKEADLQPKRPQKATQEVDR